MFYSAAMTSSGGVSGVLSQSCAPQENPDPNPMLPRKLPHHGQDPSMQRNWLPAKDVSKKAIAGINVQKIRVGRVKGAGYAKIARPPEVADAPMDIDGYAMDARLRTCPQFGNVQLAMSYSAITAAGLIDAIDAVPRAFVRTARKGGLLVDTVIRRQVVLRRAIRKRRPRVLRAIEHRPIAKLVIRRQRQGLQVPRDLICGNARGAMENCALVV